MSSTMGSLEKNRAKIFETFRLMKPTLIKDENGSNSPNSIEALLINRVQIQIQTDNGQNRLNIEEIDNYMNMQLLLMPAETRREIHQEYKKNSTLESKINFTKEYLNMVEEAIKNNSELAENVNKTRNFAIAVNHNLAIRSAKIFGDEYSIWNPEKKRFDDYNSESSAKHMEQILKDPDSLTLEAKLYLLYVIRNTYTQHNFELSLNESNNQQSIILNNSLENVLLANLKSIQSSVEEINKAGELDTMMSYHISLNTELSHIQNFILPMIKHLPKKVKFREIVNEISNIPIYRALEKYLSAKADNPFENEQPRIDFNITKLEQVQDATERLEDKISMVENYLNVMIPYAPLDAFQILERMSKELLKASMDLGDAIFENDHINKDKEDSLEDKTNNLRDRIADKIIELAREALADSMNNYIKYGSIDASGYQLIQASLSKLELGEVMDFFSNHRMYEVPDDSLMKFGTKYILDSLYNIKLYNDLDNEGFIKALADPIFSQKLRLLRNMPGNRTDENLNEILKIRANVKVDNEININKEMKKVVNKLKNNSSLLKVKLNEQKNDSEIYLQSELELIVNQHSSIMTRITDLISDIKLYGYGVTDISELKILENILLQIENSAKNLTLIDEKLSVKTKAAIPRTPDSQNLRPTARKDVPASISRNTTLNTNYDKPTNSGESNMVYTHEDIKKLLSTINDEITRNEAEEPLLGLLREYNITLNEVASDPAFKNASTNSQLQEKFNQKIQANLDGLLSGLNIIKNNKLQRENSIIAKTLITQIQGQLPRTNVSPSNSSDSDSIENRSHNRSKSPKRTIISATSTANVSTPSESQTTTNAINEDNTINNSNVSRYIDSIMELVKQRGTTADNVKAIISKVKSETGSISNREVNVISKVKHLLKELNKMEVELRKPQQVQKSQTQNNSQNDMGEKLRSASDAYIKQRNNPQSPIIKEPPQPYLKPINPRPVSSPIVSDEINQLRHHKIDGNAYDIKAIKAGINEASKEFDRGWKVQNISKNEFNIMSGENKVAHVASTSDSVIYNLESGIGDVDVIAFLKSTENTNTQPLIIEDGQASEAKRFLEGALKLQDQGSIVNIKIDHKLLNSYSPEDQQMISSLLQKQTINENFEPPEEPRPNNLKKMR